MTNITLRSANKVKLKNDLTSKTKVYNSPLYRGKRQKDSLPADLQKEDDIHSKNGQNHKTSPKYLVQKVVLRVS